MKQAAPGSSRTSRKQIQRNGVKDSLFLMQGLAEAEIAGLRNGESSVNMTPEVEDALTESLREATRVISMIQHFRQASHPTPDAGEHTANWSSVQESVYQVLHAMSYECPFHNVTLLKILPHTLPEIPIAQIHLDTILFQLVANARRNIGTESTGIITIEADAEVSESKTFFKLRVSDTGPGVPLSDMDQIFDPLVVREGRLMDNIALCLVRKLVEVNNGRIYVVSNARGASFIMEFEFLA